MLTIPNTTEELLSNIVKVLSLEIRGKVCIGYQAIAFADTTTVYTLSPPVGAITAELTLEVNGGQTAQAAGARYTLHGVNPQSSTAASSIGIPIGDGDTIELRGGDNLSSFRIINTGANSNTRVLKIVYFK